jgi:hypothetical protein
LDLGDVLTPGGFVDGVLVRAALPVDEFTHNVRVPGVLGCFRDHPDEQDAQGRLAPVFRPVRYRPRCVQVERGDDAVGVSAGALVEAKDVLAGLAGRGPHVGAVPDRAVLDPGHGLLSREAQ